MVRDVVHKGLRGGPRLSVYSLETCRGLGAGFFYVRTQAIRWSVAAALRRIVREIEPQVEVGGLHTMNEMVDDQVRHERMLSQLGGFFSLSALALCLPGPLRHPVLCRGPADTGDRRSDGPGRRDTTCSPRSFARG